jgi:flavin reductase (DIM6/NTAB) family NADH-FMN oxidoreductase RutF
VAQAHSTLQPVADKFEASGLTPEPSQKVRPPGIAECPLVFECELVKVDDTGAMTEILWGKVVSARIDERLKDLEGPALLQGLDPIYNYSFGPRDGTYHSIGPQMKLGEAS